MQLHESLLGCKNVIISWNDMTVYHWYYILFHAVETFERTPVISSVGTTVDVDVDTDVYVDGDGDVHLGVYFGEDADVDIQVYEYEY